MGKKLNIFEAAILLKMSPNLLKWFTSYAPKFKETRKLNYVDCKDDVLFFNQTELIAFNQYLVFRGLPKKMRKGQGFRVVLRMKSRQKVSLGALSAGMLRLKSHILTQSTTVKITTLII